MGPWESQRVCTMRLFFKKSLIVQPPVEVFVSCPQRRSLSVPQKRACPCLRGGLCPLWRPPAERARGRNVPCTRPKRYGGAGLVSAPPCSLALAVRQRQLAPDKSLLRLALGSVADRSERSFRVYCLDFRAHVIGTGSGLSAVPAFPTGALRTAVSVDHSQYMDV